MREKKKKKKKKKKKGFLLSPHQITLKKSSIVNLESNISSAERLFLFSLR